MPRSRFPRISSYGFLSDCHTGALVSPTGAIEWGEARGTGEWLGPWGEKVERRFEEALAGGTN